MKSRQLTEGALDLREVSKRAVEEDLRLNSENVELTGFEEAILTELQLAGALDESGKFLYSKVDFEDWLSKHESKYAISNNMPNI